MGETKELTAGSHLSLREREGEGPRATGAVILGYGRPMREGEEGEGEVGCATGRMERGRERRPIAPFLFPFLFFFPSFPI